MARELTPTADPYVFIEEQRPGYVVYRNTTTGRRWAVHGTCDRRGDCLIGAIVENEHGEPEKIRDYNHIAELRRRKGSSRIDSEFDVPVTPEFDICCGADIFTYEELGEASGD